MEIKIDYPHFNELSSLEEITVSLLESLLYMCVSLEEYCLLESILSLSPLNYSLRPQFTNMRNGNNGQRRLINSS